MPDFVSDRFATSALRANPRRIDVELHGVDQAVPSYEGRLFLGNEDAGRDTPLTEQEGFLGSFFIFGKVHCWGEDEGHCHPASSRRFDRRRPPGRYAKVRVTVPAGRVERLAERMGDAATLTVVAVATAPPGQQAQATLRFDRLSLITYA